MHDWGVLQTTPAPRQPWKLRSNRQSHANWFCHRTASSLMRSAIGWPLSHNVHIRELIAFASFERILVRTCLSRWLVILFSQQRVASSRPLSWLSKTLNHDPCRNDVALNFITSPRVRGLCCSSLDSCDRFGMGSWSHTGTAALLERLPADG